jgi:hypothetical protein
MADGVAVQAKKLRNLVRIVKLSCLNQIDPIPAPARRLPIASKHRGSPVAARRDAVCDPPVDLAFDPRHIWNEN